MTLASPVGVGVLEPVDVLGAVPLGIVDVELAPLAALGVFPVDFLAPGLDDVQVEVGLGVPEQGELRVADLDLDAPDILAPLAEPRQPEAVPLPRPRVVRIHPSLAAGRLGPPRLPAAVFDAGDVRSSGFRPSGSARGPSSRASGIASGVFRPPVIERPSSTPISEPIRRVSIGFAGGALGAKYQNARASSNNPCRTSDEAHPFDRFEGEEAALRTLRDRGP